MPFMYVSPHWCILCKQHRESIGHVFVSCKFSPSFWNKIISLFSWLVALPTNMHLISASHLPSLIIPSRTRNYVFGYILYGSYCGPFRWKGIRGSSKIRNAHFTIFVSLYFFGYFSVYILTLFHHYSFASLLSNWRAFFVTPYRVLSLFCNLISSYQWNFFLKKNILVMIFSEVTIITIINHDIWKLDTR